MTKLTLGQNIHHIRMQKVLFPKELIILMAIVHAEEVAVSHGSHPISAEAEYVNRLYDSLIARGYLEEYGSGQYILSSKGEEAFSSFLNNNKARAIETVRTLRRLNIRSKSLQISL